MNLVLSTAEHFDAVKNIVLTTVREQYPLYYPSGAVDFFLSHHCDENILRDIKGGLVYLLEDGGEFIGTGTVNKNELCRLFVLPGYQGKGYGTAILDKLENLIFENYDEIKLDASLPAYNLYVHRGYHPVEYHRYKTPAGDYLCYHIMIKHRK